MAKYGHMAIYGQNSIFENFPLYIPLNTKNRSPHVILLSITLKFFVTSYNPIAWLVKKYKLNLKKKRIV